MNAPKLLDLFCCEGGAAYGYHQAGFDVIGVDINPQPLYPFTFHQGDALEVMRGLILSDVLGFPVKLAGEEYVGVYGDHADTFSTRPNGTSRGVKAATDDEAREVMGMPWASWHGTTQAIPPAYSLHIGAQLIAHLTTEVSA